MRAGSFTVGDFALFVSYLGWLTELTSMFGNFLAQYRQMRRLAGSPVALLQGAAARVPGRARADLPATRSAVPPSPVPRTHARDTGCIRLDSRPA